MPKKQQKYESSEDDQDDDIESYDDEMDDSNDINDNEDREIEINKEHILNYESDDSSDGMNDSEQDDLDKGLAKQKEDLIMNDTWGSKKRNFYGRDKKHDVNNFQYNYFSRTRVPVQMMKTSVQRLLDYRK